MRAHGWVPRVAEEAIEAWWRGDEGNRHLRRSEHVRRRGGRIGVVPVGVAVDRFLAGRVYEALRG